jgi:hypothetical protein
MNDEDRDDVGFSSRRVLLVLEELEAEAPQALKMDDSYAVDDLLRENDDFRAGYQLACFQIATEMLRRSVGG